MVLITFLNLLVLFHFHLKTINSLNVVYQWKSLDFQFSSNQTRRKMLNTSTFVPANNVPNDMEVYGDRIFLTLPRWRKGVAASLAYFYLSADDESSPKLHPYPNWESHQLLTNDSTQIISSWRMYIDRCDRLWIIDIGAIEIDEKETILLPVRLLIFNLLNDTLIRIQDLSSYEKDNSFLGNLIVEDHDCQNSFAYIADVGFPSLIVYSWKTQRIRVLKNDFFNVDPAAEKMESYIEIVWSDGIFGLALTKPNKLGFSTLYFHPLNSFSEFSVGSHFLQNSSTQIDFRKIGERDRNNFTQSGTSVIDKPSGILFYTLLNHNSIMCWNTNNENYENWNQGEIFSDDVTLRFPSDVNIDSNGNLWVLSNRLTQFLYRNLSYNEINFRIFRKSVADVVKGTVCENVSNILSPPSILIIIILIIFTIM